MANLTQPLLLESTVDSLLFNTILLYSLLCAASIAATFYFTTISRSPKVAPVATKSTGSGLQDENSSSIATYITSKDCDGIIFFGSQTGTAEDFSRRLARALQDSFDLSVACASLDEFNMATLSQVPLIQSSNRKKMCVGFVVATYGDGEPTDDAADFHKLLSDDSEEFTGSIPRSEKPLSGLNYITFGLGNRTYENYNSMVRFVKDKLDSLGAARVGEVGEGDDGAGTMDEDFL